MQPIHLDPDDYFRIIRGLLYAEIKAIRRISDVFGDELTLTSESTLDQEPLTASPEERERMARRVAGFFGLGQDGDPRLLALPALGDWTRHVYDRIGPRPTTITFFTSGSTGEPKPILRPYFFLEQDAHHLATQLSGTKRMVGLVPSQHIYGFIYTILIPKVLGVEYVDARFQRPAAIIRGLIEGDAIIGIPHFWKLFTETRERFPARVMGVTSTGPCPPEVIRTLRKQGLPVMHEIYGSSESGAMGHRSSPDEPLRLMPIWKRVSETLFTRPMEDGRDSDPFNFQDELEWLDDSRFYVKRRLDSAVQVAGINVYPQRVVEALLSHEAVAECAVRLMRPEEGDRLKAFVVLKPGVAAGSAALEALQRHVAARLGRLERPKSYVFGEALPRNEMGKLSDWSIRSEESGLTRELALERLRQEHHAVPPGQTFTVDRLRPEDAWGVAHLFFELYGDRFPFDTYYIPERLLEENRRGVTHSVVARTPVGDVVGYAGLYRSSAPYHGTFEVGRQNLLPDYQSTHAGLLIQDHIAQTLIPERQVEVFFSEAVCHNIVTQKFGAMSRWVESALEIGLMPPDAYGPTDFPDDRVSTLLQFGFTRDARRVLHCPEVYQDAMAYLLQGLGMERDIQPSEDEPPGDIATRSSVEVFDFAQVARMHVLTLGRDFPSVLDSFEEQARGRGARVLQVFINLGEPWCSSGVDALRARGFFLGGLLPRWFDDDGLLLQRVLDMPGLQSIKLHSQRAHRILDLIRRDLESNPACSRPRPVSTAPAPSRSFKAADLSEVVLAGEGLTISQVVAVARRGIPVRLTQDRQVLDRVEASASFIQWAVRTGEPIYGVNTGFGGMANVAIGEADLGALQHNLLRFLNAGAGDFLPAEDVRAAMLLRVNSHLRGASGVRRELLDRLLVFLNRNVTPLVRDLGSIGASGDLVPLASITGALVGASPAFKVLMEGEIVGCLEALARLKLAPFELGPKEGLGMVNGTSVMTGIAANVLYDARRSTALALGFHALAVQALQATNQSFHPFIQQVKPHPGQARAAALMLDLLDGSRLCRHELDGHHDTQGDQPVQDRYSMRCLPQFLGPILDGLRHAASAIEVEMNSANDNPLIDGPNCISYHGGNFLGQYVGVWMDHLRYYLGLMAKHMDAQIALLAAPEFNAGLPASLVGNPARTVNMGLKGLQIAANSISPLLSFYGAPVADRFPTHAEQFNQNINSQGFNAANLARKSMTALESYLAMALLFGVQAVSLRSARMAATHDPRPLLSPTTAALYDAVFAVLERQPRPDRPLIWNDDEQSLEEMVQALRRDMIADGGTVEAMGQILAGLS